MATQTLGGTPSAAASHFQVRSRNSVRTGTTGYRGQSNATRSLSSPNMREAGSPPIPTPNVAIPTGMISPSTDTRPPQPPQNSGLYDNRPPVHGRHAPDSNTTEGVRSQHSRGPKSVELLPSQIPVRQQPQQQQQQQPQQPKVLHKRQSVRPGANKSKRASKMDQASYENDGDEMHDDDAKDRRGSGSLRAVFKKMFSSSKTRKEEPVMPRRPVTRGQDGQSKSQWPVSLKPKDYQVDSLTSSIL